MCQPGRPRPHGDGQYASAGSSGLAPFQRAKSRGSRLPRSGASPADCMASGDWPDSAPYAGQEATSK